MLPPPPDARRSRRRCPWKLLSRLLLFLEACSCDSPEVRWFRLRSRGPARMALGIASGPPSRQCAVQHQRERIGHEPARYERRALASPAVQAADPLPKYAKQNTEVPVE